MDEIEKLVYKSIFDKLKKKKMNGFTSRPHHYQSEVLKCEQGHCKSEIRIYMCVEMGAMH